MDITPEELKDMITLGNAPLIIDVRDESEWLSGHIAQAHNIPLRNIHKLDGLANPKQEIVVHCRTGIRAAEAQGILRSLGFTNVRNLTGGFVAWIRINK